MMSELGSIAIALGICVSAYATVGSLIGVRFQIPELVSSARRGIYLVLLCALTASAALLIAFITNDFSVRYVFENSNLVMGRGYTLVAFYAANEGSLLFITLALSMMSALSIRFAPRSFAAAIPYTTAILSAVLGFFFTTMLFLANPFELLDTTPLDGRGINPLLLHPGMYSHPPFIMSGLIGITIPFSFAAGALISGRYGDDWVDIARVFAIIMWGVLGVGMLIGSWWAYTILGWGGYWAWDPIENVAFMPWLVLTAFIHSIMVQKRRGMFRMWNIALINIAFVLSQLGIFINRGGTVVSVHSFAESSLGYVFLAFMILSLLFAFTIFLWRYPDLRSERAIESFLSREASFLVNNFLLLVVTAVVLWGVVFPLFSSLARDVDVSVAAPYFNRVNGPILLALIVIMGVGPLLPWRRTAARSLKRWLLAPLATAAAVAIGLVAAGITEFWAVTAFAAVAFAATAVLEEWWFGTRARMSNLSESLPIAWWRLVNGNRPRHGGYIVHLAILSLATGVVGTQFFDQRFDAAIHPGESLVIDNYRLELREKFAHDRPDRLAQWAAIDIYTVNPDEYSIEREQAASEGRSGFTVASEARPGDRLVGYVEPRHEFHRSHSQVSVRAGIRTNLLEDLYVTPRDFLQDGRVSFAVSINPLALWLWIAGPIFVLGTIVALWPQPTLEKRPARLRSHARAPQIDPTVDKVRG